MFPFSHFRKKPLIGLDISTDEVRLLQLRHGRRGWVIENVALTALPSGAIVDGKLKQFEHVRSAIASLVKKTQTEKCPTAIALPGSSVISKRIKLAVCLRDIECEAEIRTHLNHYLPGMREEICFDYVALAPVDHDEKEMLLFASRAEQLQSYVAVVNQAGLHVKIVDVDSYALSRAAMLSLPFSLPTDASVAIVNVGVVLTQFIVLQGQQIIFSQQWATGEMLMAEAELKRVIQFCLSIHRELQIHHLIFVGKKIELQQDVSIETVIVDPFQNMLLAVNVRRQELQEAASRLLVCCGLAMRSALV